jgi:hypothetical protein
MSSWPLSAYSTSDQICWDSDSILQLQQHQASIQEEFNRIQSQAQEQVEQLNQQLLAVPKEKDEEKSVGKNKKRIRSADVSELSFIGVYNKESGPMYEKIRVWENSRRMVFYDCECGKRKPVQDLQKIMRHVERHQVNLYVCDICRKGFSKHLQLNAHMKAHRSASHER